MKRVGAITIGQAPRTDVMEDIGDSKVQHVSELRLNGKLLDASFLNG